MCGNLHSIVCIHEVSARTRLSLWSDVFRYITMLRKVFDRGTLLYVSTSVSQGSVSLVGLFRRHSSLVHVVSDFVSEICVFFAFCIWVGPDQFCVSKLGPLRILYLCAVFCDAISMQAI
jgi:hypothetical protein